MLVHVLVWFIRKYDIRCKHMLEIQILNLPDGRSFENCSNSDAMLQKITYDSDTIRYSRTTSGFHTKIMILVFFVVSIVFLKAG